MWWLLFACRGPVAPEPVAPGHPPVEAATAALHAEFRSVVEVRWTQAETADTWVEYRFADEDWRASPRRAVEPGAASALLLGIPYDEEVRWRIAADLGQGPVYGEDATLRTEPLPEGVPVAVSATGDPDRWEPTLRWLFLSLSERPREGDYGLLQPWWVLVVDRQGRVVWARRTPTDAVSLHPRVAADGGSLLVDESTFWGSFDEGRGSRIHRMYLDGTVAETFETPGLHHPFTDTPDGALLWNAYAGGDETIEERAPDGTVRTVWDCGDSLAALGASGDCGSNTLAWDEPTGQLLFSSYALGTVFAVDRARGATLRTYGQLQGSWAMNPADANFWWQHGVHYTGEGTLLVSTWQSASGEGTVVREYALDEAASTLHEVWNLGVGDHVFGEFMGEPWRLPGGNTLHNTGSLPRLREATPTGEIVWDLDWSQREGRPDDAWLGRSTPLADLYALLPPE